MRRARALQQRVGINVIANLSDATANEVVAELALQVQRTSATAPGVAQPRIAMYRPWVRPSMDEGWTRWVLENYDFEFTSLRNEDVRAGRLRNRYDVIIIADESARQIIDGAALGSVPGRYAGGIGTRGVRASSTPSCAPAARWCASTRAAPLPSGLFICRCKTSLRSLSAMSFTCRDQSSR